MDFLTRLNLLKKALGLTPLKVSKDIGLSAAYCYDIFSGKMSANPKFLEGFATCYGVSLDYLVLGRGGMFREREVREAVELDGVIKSILEALNGNEDLRRHVEFYLAVNMLKK